MKINIILLFLSIQLFGFTKKEIHEPSSRNGAITYEVESKKVFLKTYLKKNKLYLEIPVGMLNTPMLFVRYDEGQKVNYKQVVWSKHEAYVILDVPHVTSEVGVIIPINKASAIFNYTIGKFPIVKESSTSKVICINITELILGNIIQWSSGFNETVVSDLSFVSELKHLDNEVIIKTRRGVLRNKIKLTMDAVFSFYLLSEPMRPRLYDHRMSFMIEDTKGEFYRVPESPKASVTRWRLEKKHKDKKMSEPVKPITYILSPEIPEKWRPYVRAGINEWLPAFEAAGFKNAIVVKDDSSESKLWEQYSVNHSIVRWGNYQDVRGYDDSGGSTILKIVDLRSGEIIKADILIASSIQSLADSYFIRCAPLDKRAQQYPITDDLMGELIQFVTAHEAGHTFGLLDNHYGEYAYPFEKMRDSTWLREMGHTPSVMSYARHNYIPQPEDGISPELLIQKVGPTDSYNIRWAYTPFDNTHSAEEETPYLEEIVRLQDSIPWYRYSYSVNDVIGPGMTNEVVDNDDPINTTKMGLKNMKRVFDLIPQVNKNQKDQALVERLYEKSLDLWSHEMRHVLSLVGGYTAQYKSGSQEGSIYIPIPLEKQEEALGFFLQNAFNPPEWLESPEFLEAMRYSSFPDKLMESQLNLLFKLLKNHRMKRLEFMEINMKNNTISETFVLKVQSVLFQELQEERFQITPRKQEIQSVYVEKLCNVFKQELMDLRASAQRGNYTNYSKSLFMSSLLSLKKEINKNKMKSNDQITRGHLNLILNQIENI